MGTLKDELVEKAKELGIEVNDEMDDESLESAIKEKEGKDDKKDGNNPSKLEKEELLKQLEFQKEENKKAYEARDKSKAEKRETAKKLKELEDKLKGSPDAEQFKEMQEKLAEYEKERKAREEEEKKKKLEQMDEADRLKVEFNDQMKAFQDEMDKKIKEAYGVAEEKEKEIKDRDTKIDTLSRRTLMAEIKSAAAENNALNPNQIVKMTLNEFKFNDGLGEFEHVKYDARGKEEEVLSVAEYIKNFLEDEDNANLVKADSSGDGLDTKGGSPGSSKDKDKKGDRTKRYDKYDPKNPDIKREAELRGMEPERYAELVKKNDVITGKLKEE